MASARHVCTLVAVLTLTALAQAGFASNPQSVVAMRKTDYVGEADPFLPFAKQYFAEAQVAAAADGGRLWGRKLLTPILLIDDGTRKIYGTQADLEGRLKEVDGVWVGDLPANLPVANFAFKWAGVRWMIVARSSLPGSLTERFTLFMHETFHWFQPELGLFAPSGPCPHLDTYEGRVWLRLEGRALERCMVESNREEQTKHLRNALLFRRYRQSIFTSAPEKERLLELNEGLAQYTGVRLMGLPSEETLRYVSRVLGRWPQSRPSFARTYAYDLLPAYGLLLDEMESGWRTRLNKDSDVVGMAARAISWESPSSLKHDAAAAARAYGYARIVGEERARDKEHKQSQAILERKFIKGPVITLPRPSRKTFSFRTDMLTELENYGTVYRNMQLEDVWGKVVIGEDGILVSADGSSAVISIEGDGSLLNSATGSSGAQVGGKGWKLELAPGWKLAPGLRKGDFEVRKAEAVEAAAGCWNLPSNACASNACAYCMENLPCSHSHPCPKRAEG